jgi:polyhydroxybutyrate depolymerase
MRFILALLLVLTSPALACSPDTDCVVGDRTYRIALPEGHDGITPVPALVWSHGYRGSAAGVMRNGALRRMVSDAGFALIAVQGVNGSWDLPYGPGTYDSDGSAEFAYFDAVIDDATAKNAIDPDKIIASGFSAGGMMVWYLACSHPDNFAGFIPMSGTFWLKPPETCKEPVSSIIHIHGSEDTTVPLKGRAIRETKQGEVSEAVSMYARLGDFKPQATPMQATDGLACTSQRNPAGEMLETCIFKGGHSFNVGFLQYGIEALKAAGQF